MRISGTFLASKISQRIAVLLFIAAVIPATLMTLLSNQKVSTLIANYEHQTLVEKSRNYAMSAFSNMVFARHQFKDILKKHENIVDVNNLYIQFASDDYKIFQSVTQILPNGLVISSHDNPTIPPEIRQDKSQYQFEKVYLIIADNQNGETDPSINLILRHKNQREIIYI